MCIALPSQAMEKKHSFSKSVYSMIFTWLVEQINSTLAPFTKGDSWGKILHISLCMRERIAAHPSIVSIV